MSPVHVQHADHGHAHHPTGWRRFVYSTNHKDIGTMYLVFAIIAGIIGAMFSVMMRAELQEPGLGTGLFGTDADPHGQYWNVVITRARPDHGLLRGHAGDDRRLRQLVRAADDRRAGHGLPAHEQHQLLAADPVLRAAARLGLRRRYGDRRRRRRLDALSAAFRLRARALRARRSTWRSSRCTSPAPRRSSARSTSSPRSSTCARRA